MAPPRMGQVKSIFASRRVSLRGNGAQGWTGASGAIRTVGVHHPGDNKEEGDEVTLRGGGPFLHPGEDRGVVAPMQGTGDAKFQWW